MKKLLTVLTCLMAISCTSFNSETKGAFATSNRVSAAEPRGTRQVVRVTYYTAGEDRFGSKTSTGERAQSMKTCAVDPKVFKYGTKLHVPGIGLLKANDTGSAVKSRKAARSQGRNVPVIDVFVSNRSMMRYMEKTQPMFREIIIPVDNERL